jgi:two-component system sensor histidine kinase KdpD
MQLASAWERFRLQQSVTNARVDESAARLRSALLASVSHDLRTPLVSIIGSLSALKDIDAHLTAADRAALTQTALEESERLNRFVQNLLDMTRLSYGALTPRLASVSVREAVEESIRRLGGVLATRPVELKIDATLPPAWADRTLLEQVLVNLLDNAAKYSPVAEPLTVEAHADGGDIVVAVSDRGTGIPPEEADKVFDLFYRARQRDSVATGQGLGLPICRGFVDAMGGRIRALRGRDDRGTTMEVTLPAANAAATLAGETR